MVGFHFKVRRAESEHEDVAVLLELGGELGPEHGVVLRGDIAEGVLEGQPTEKHGRTEAQKGVTGDGDGDENERGECSWRARVCVMGVVRRIVGDGRGLRGGCVGVG